MQTLERTSKSKARPERVPALYRPEYAEQGRKLCLLLGATDQELARFFDVPLAALRDWLASVPEFAAAVRAGNMQSASGYPAVSGGLATGSMPCFMLFVPDGALAPPTRRRQLWDR